MHSGSTASCSPQGLYPAYTMNWTNWEAHSPTQAGTDSAVLLTPKSTSPCALLFHVPLLLATHNASFPVSRTLRKVVGTPQVKIEVYHLASFQQRHSLGCRNSGLFGSEALHETAVMGDFCQWGTSGKSLPLSITIHCKYRGVWTGENYNMWWHETGKLKEQTLEALYISSNTPFSPPSETIPEASIQLDCHLVDWKTQSGRGRKDKLLLRALENLHF
jgi:hypothetical protein